MRCSGRLFYTTILVVTLLRQLRVKADSATFAAIPVCREPVSTTFSSVMVTAVDTVCVLLAALTECFPSASTDTSFLTTRLFIGCRRFIG